MDETKIYNKLVELEERIESWDQRIKSLPDNDAIISRLDALVHTQSTLDTERLVANHRLDEYEHRLTLVERAINTPQ